MLARVERKIMKHGSSGVLAIPKAYRDYYKLNPGVTVTGSSSEACTGTISCGLQSNVKRPASSSVGLCWTSTAFHWKAIYVKADQLEKIVEER